MQKISKIYIYAAISGFILALVFYFPKLSPILFFSFIPLLTSFRKKSFKNIKEKIIVGTISGFLLGFCYALFSTFALWPSSEATNYFFNSLSGYFKSQGIDAPNFYDLFLKIFFITNFIVIFVLSILLSLPYILWGFGISIFSSERKNFILTVPSLWIIAEWLRSKIFFDLSWGDVGYYFTDYPLIAILSRFGGRYGIAFLVLLINSLLVEFYFLTKNKSNIFLFSILLIFPISILGFYEYFLTLKNIDKGEKLNVIVLQGYIPWGRDYKLDAEKNFEFPEPYNSQLIELLSLKEKVDIIVMPELVINNFAFNFNDPFLDHYNDDDLSLWKKELMFISDYLKKNNSSILILGQPIKENDLTYNGIIVFTSSGKTFFYKKRKLFPFVESSPSYFDFSTYFERLGFNYEANKYSSGDNNSFLKIDNLNIAVASCLEIESAKIFNASISKEPSFIVTLGSEIGFNEFARRYQLYLTRFRAIEQNKWVVRATKRGFSVIVDPLGRISSVISSSTSDGMIKSFIFLKQGKTLYSSIGDGWIILGAYVMVIYSIFDFGLRRRLT